MALAKQMTANALLCPGPGGVGIYIDWCITFISLQGKSTSMCELIYRTNLGLGMPRKQICANIHEQTVTRKDE